MENPHPPPRMECCEAPPNDIPIVITTAEEVPRHVGELVTLRGPVPSDHKLPTLLGVQVSCDRSDWPPKEAEATGVLRTYVMSQEWIDAESARIGIFAHEGAGTHYVLTEPTRNRKVKVRPIP